MITLVSRLRAKLRSDRGAMLPIFGLMLVVLIGLAAFAVDLGWFFVNATRVQRTAEAAALSGVVELPNDVPGATSTALDVADHNGYPVDTDTTVTVVPQPGGNETRLQVTVTDTVPTFFTSVFGMDNVTISRTATAEYVPPLPLGSPINQFGNSCDPTQPGCSGQPNFWANIHGRHTDTRMGDAYSSFCADGTGSGSSGCGVNPSYRSSGYLYGVERGTASNFEIQFVDLEHRNNSGSEPTNDDHRTGDRGCEAWGSGGPGCGMTMAVYLYGPDATPLDWTDNPLLCSQTIAPVPQIAESDPYSWIRPSSCFRVDPALPGIYVVRVEVTDSGGDDDGLNRYAIRADSVSGTPLLYGIGDMSLYNNADGTLTDFFLARVDEFYRGRQFVVELYDPGEATPGGDVQLLAPSGAAWAPAASCDMFTRDEVTDPWVSQGTQAPCEFFANTTLYNGQWIKLEITLADTYACGSNCWWKLNYDYPGPVNDTTTWRAYVVGAPVHLVPNGG